MTRVYSSPIRRYLSNVDVDIDLGSNYMWCPEQAASTEANKKYLLLKDDSGNVRRVPSYDDA